MKKRETYVRFYKEEGWLWSNERKVSVRDPRKLIIPGKLTTEIEFYDRINEYDENGRLISQGPETNRETWVIGELKENIDYEGYFDVHNDVSGKDYNLGTVAKDQLVKVVSPSELRYQNPIEHRIEYAIYNNSSNETINKATDITDIKDLKVVPYGVCEVVLFDINLDESWDKNQERYFSSEKRYYIGDFKNPKQSEREFNRPISYYKPILGFCFFSNSRNENFRYIVIENKKQLKHIISPSKFEIDYDYKNVSETAEQE